MSMITHIFRDALEVLAARGDLAAMEGVLAKVHGYGPWQAAETAASLCALPPEGVRALLGRMFPDRG